MTTKANMLRRLLGLPPVRKHRTRLRKTSIRKTQTRPRKKQPTKFQQGWQTAQTLTNSWNSQPNPPQVYVFDRRVHHGEVGVLAGLAGIINKDPFWTGFGARLALDDIHDANEWFTFKKRETIPSLSYNHNFA
jgi:hypothetical protein